VPLRRSHVIGYDVEYDGAGAEEVLLSQNRSQSESGRKEALWSAIGAGGLTFTRGSRTRCPGYGPDLM
jgi:hypothetical protein